MSSEHSTVSAEELSSSSSPYIKSIRKRDISPSVVFAIDLLNHLLHHILFLYRASASSFGSSSLRDTWWPDVRGEVEYWLEEILERAAPTRVLTLLNSSPKSIFHILQPGKLGRLSWLLRRASLWSSSACGISERWYCWRGRGFGGMNTRIQDTRIYQRTLAMALEDPVETPEI